MNWNFRLVRIFWKRLKFEKWKWQMNFALFCYNPRMADEMITSATDFLLVGYTVSFKCVVLFWPVSMILIDQGIKIWSSSHQNPWSSILKETQRRKEIISSKLYPPSHCSTKSIGWLTAHSYEYLHTIYKVNDYDLSLNF